MAATVPVRLDKKLIALAAAEAEHQKRTAPKQIEYWAALGQSLEGVLGRDDVIRLRAGLSRVEPVNAAPLDVDSVFAAVESARAVGDLSVHVTGARIIYQASRENPAYLEQIHPNGRIVVGRFEDGTFQPLPS